MFNNLPTGEEILEQLMQKVAPLPCQISYARNLACLFAMHLRKNALMDAGFSPEELPVTSAMVVVPSGQGKTYLMQQMAKVVDVNFIEIDASALSREGRKGINLSQQLLAARKAARSPDFLNAPFCFWMKRTSW